MIRSLPRHPWRPLVLGLAVGALVATSAFALEVPTVERGFKPEQAFQIGDIDHIRLLSGGLELAIPLGIRYPVGGAGLSYGFTLHYSSQLWEFSQVWVVPDNEYRTSAIPVVGTNAGFGWRLSLGELGVPGSGRPCELCYVDPSGARHEFGTELHYDVPGQPGRWFTNDGTFLRLRQVASEWEVEFPSGEIHKFDSTGRLIEMRDRFTGWVHVAYTASSWTITDSEGRVHSVVLATVPYYGKAVSSLTLGAFGTGNTADYSFTYANTEVPRSCLDWDPLTPDTIQLPLLTGVSIPESMSFSMPLSSYYLQADLGCPDGGARQGLLQKVVLPTLGSVEWTFGPYYFPVPTDATPIEDFPPTWLAAVTGVWSRTLRTAAGAVEGTWTYGQSLPQGSASLESITSVTTPLGDRTDHYFNIGQQTNVTYGLSFSPEETGAPQRNDLYRSTKVYDCDPGGVNCVLKRETFLKYATSSEDPAFPFESNPRVAATMTRFVDDPSFWAAVDYGSYDGLGHFRIETTSGNFASGNARTTTTNYNPNSGTYPGSFVLPSASGPWVLGTYDRIDATEGIGTARTEACFETNGFLKRVRTLKTGTTRGASDLLAVYVAGTQGHRAEERYYGGDVANNLDTSASPLCTMPVPADEQYQIRNTIASGSLATSQYYDAEDEALPFYSVRRDIDPGTGLVATSYDVAGLATDYEYDDLGRLNWVMPAAGNNDGWTEYDYTSAISPSSLAKLQIRRRDNGSQAATVQAESELRFDSFGRLAEELRRMPGATVWASRETKYDAEGRRASISEWGNFAKKTTYGGYDPFGRPATITPPDGATHAVTFTYKGIRQIERRSKVGTAASEPGGVLETESLTTEVYDRQGRLLSVTEPSGAAGANTTTTYSYDVGNRLKQATTPSGVTTQTRLFTYDNRGLLGNETHPEKGISGNGSVSYPLYDARGHVRRRIDGPNDLTFVYDRAERLDLVRETGGDQRSLKDFAYSETAGPGLGKLLTAERFNYAVVGETAITGRVRETYDYSGRNGRIGGRTTEFFIDPSMTPTETWEQGFEYTPLGEIDLLDYPRCTAGNCMAASETRQTVYGFQRGWLASVQEPSQPSWATVSYYLNGMPSQIEHRNGVDVVIGGDPNAMQRPASFATTGVSPGTDWSTGSYAYDGSGNVVAIGDAIFLYDRVNRLKQAKVRLVPTGPALRGESPDESLIFADDFESGTLGAWTVPGDPNWASQAYTYDAFGNLTAVSGDLGHSIPITPGTNRVSTSSYDAAGNMLSWNGNTYSYGPFNEVTRTMTAAGSEWLHVYTADDERLFSWELGGEEVTRWTLRGLDQRVLREYHHSRAVGGTSFIEQDNIYRGTGPLLAAVTPAGERHFHVDHLGTPRLITDASGAQVAFHAYYPYGEEATEVDQDTLRYKFTGHERDLVDPSSGADDLDHMHARMSNPQLGRFLSTDPGGANPKVPQSWNRYAYGFGNPVKYVDPTGEMAEEQARIEACELGLFCTLYDWFIGLLPQRQDPAPMQGIEELEAELGPTGDQFDQTAVEGKTLLGLNEATATIGAGAVTAAIVVGGNAAGNIVVNKLDDIFLNPAILRGVTPSMTSLAKAAEQAGYRVETLSRGSRAGQGMVLREQVEGRLTGRLISWHPGGGHHGPEPYWKVSSPQGGTVRVGPQF